MRIARLPAFAAGAALLVGVQLPIPAAAASPLVIGVDHADSANQQPFAGRVFEYTDFFSRHVTVHTGDRIDLQSAPASFHIVALARTELWARSTYPVALADNDRGGLTDIATGSVPTNSSSARRISNYGRQPPRWWHDRLHPRLWPTGVRRGAAR